jgi:hypothetical protein
VSILNDLSPKAIARLQAEFKRLKGMTSFQRINERSADHKADAWLAYAPLSIERFEDDESETITVVNIVDGQLADRRSTLTNIAGWHTPFLIVKRPTELLAAAHLEHRYVLDSEYPPLPHIASPAERLRWCILCKERHEPHAFMQSKRYLNGLSYACKPKLRSLRRAQWRFGDSLFDTSRIITIEKNIRKSYEQSQTL